MLNNHLMSANSTLVSTPSYRHSRTGRRGAKTCRCATAPALMYLLCGRPRTRWDAASDQNAAPAQGIENANVAPCPSLGTAQRRPPWLSTIDLLTDRPMPIPWGFVV